ncbi:MAG: ABC transporter ATP-binding protein [Pseudomonadota bacterium]
MTDLSVGYTTPVLTGVAFAMPPGAWWALLGPNGCGKSTLLDTLSGRLAPLAGHVAIAGHRLDRQPLAAKRALGYAVPPERLPGRLTGRECLDVFVHANGDGRDSDHVRALIAAWAFETDLRRYVDRMSLGMRQKVGLLLAFAGQPDVLLLDESLNGLDATSALALKRHLRDGVDARAFSVLLATHAMDVVSEYADRALVVNNGAIALRLDRSAWQQADLPLDRLIAQRLAEPQA